MASTVSFSGYTWEVTDGVQNPDMNNFSKDNIWVDGNGWLHLKLSKDAAGSWRSAQVVSLQTFRYGTYIWEVEGPVDKLDKNIVLGLFNYKNGENMLHEVDIEFARWGNDNWPNYNYTVYPASSGTEQVSQTYELKLNGTYSTHTFTRTSTSVSYKGFHGFTTDEVNAFFPWSTPDGFPVSSLSLPILMNLWLKDGVPPSNGADVEIVIHSFKFVPA